MGGGKDQKAANTQLESQHKYQAEQQKAFDARNTADLDASRGRGDELYQSLKGGYQNLAGGAGGGGGGGGGYQAPGLDPRYKDIEDMYTGYMKTGGWDADVKGKQQGRIDALTEIGKTGGVSEADQARARGGGGYEEFAKTGGFNDKDIANIRTRGTSGIPAMYQRMADERNRGAKISGGFGPGAAVLAGRMGRQQAGAAADASLNTELGIKNQVNQGRQWGIGGQAESEQNLQGLLTGNKLQGLQAGSDIQGKMQESIMGGQQWGTGGQKGLVDEAQARAEAQAQAAAAASAGAAGQSFQERMAGLEGLQGLYSGGGSEEYNTNKDYALKSSGVYGQGVGQAAVNQKTGNVNPWDNVAKVGGAIAGGLTGIGAIGQGVGALGSMAKSQQQMPQSWANYGS